MYYHKCKKDTAMELYDAHVAAKTALDSAACSKKGKKPNKKDTDAPKRHVSFQENEESFQQDKVEAMKLYLKYNKIRNNKISENVTH